MADLWWKGQISALPTAFVFALVVNGLLVAKFIYPDWLNSGLVRLACWTGLAIWGFWVARSIKELPEILVPREVSDQPDRFPEAQTAYLTGDWSLAESLLTDVLSIEPRDPPALLFLCGVYRHTSRLEAAEVLLAEVSRLEVTDRWQIELDAEKKRLERAQKAPIPTV